MDENMNMENEVLETEVVDDDYDYDVVETEPGGSGGMAKTAVKAVIGFGVAIGGFFGIRKAVKKRQEKYIVQTPKGLIKCK